MGIGKRMVLGGLAAGCLLLWARCEYEIPAALYPSSGSPDPVIASVSPDSAFGGVTDIRIRGRNFDPVPGRNFVFFGSAEAFVKSALDTELLVVRPMAVRDTVTIKVAVERAFGTAAFGPFKLEPGLLDVGGLGLVYCFAVDGAEALYAQVDLPGRTILKITPDGAVAEYGKLPFRAATAMRMGPDGALLVQKEDSKSLYRIPTGGGEAEEYFFHKRKVSAIDFDANGNLFAGGIGNGMFVSNPAAGTSVDAGAYQDLPIRSVRVFDGYVYAAVEDSAQGGVWRNRILTADGQVGENERVLAWSTTGAYATATLYDITFSEDGDLYLATNKDPDPVLVMHPDGSLEPLHPGMLPAPVTGLFWGNGNYLYMNQSDMDHQGVSRVILGKPGATVYGRNP